MTTSQDQSRETGIRSVNVRGVAVSISNQRGALLLVVPASFHGRRITIKGKAADPMTWRVCVYATVFEHKRNGKTQYIAVSPRLLPGNYYLDAGGHHGFDEFTIDRAYVSQMQWTY